MSDPVFVKMLGNGSIAETSLSFVAQAKRKGDAEKETPWTNISAPCSDIAYARNSCVMFAAVSPKNSEEWETRIVQIYEKVVME